MFKNDNEVDKFTTSGFFRYAIYTLLKIFTLPIYTHTHRRRVNKKKH